MTEFQRTFKLSKLYYKFVHFEQDLKSTGITPLELARALESAGFIRLIESDTRYIELPKLFNPKHKRELFKTIHRAARSRGGKLPTEEVEP